tara:strand:- start:530 stop:928 length:399 start_codon:yes stop_codon:yes gene_type:complete
MGALVSQKPLPKDADTIALRTAANILDKWEASSKQASKILRVSPTTIFRAKSKTREVSLDEDQMMRVSLILNIHSALKLIFDNPVNVYGFIKMKNNNGFFNGRSPLEVIEQGSMINLYETFKRIDGLRGAQW